MKRPHLPLTVLSALIVSMTVIAPTALAETPVFLLAEWLINNEPLSAPLLVEGVGEVNLINLNGGGLGVIVEILCSGIGDGTVGPVSLGLITSFLSLSGEEISGEPLVGLSLTCGNTKNCEGALIWPEELPWENELELLEETAGTFFVDLTFGGKYYISCLILGVEVNELCTAAVAVTLVENLAGGIVRGEVDDPLTELAGLPLGECGSHAETAELSGLGELLPDSGSLTVSSGA